MSYIQKIYKYEYLVFDKNSLKKFACESNTGSSSLIYSTSIALHKAIRIQEFIRSRLHYFVLILTIVVNLFSHRYVEAKGNKCCKAMVNKCGYFFRICIENCTKLFFLKSEF